MRTIQLTKQTKERLQTYATANELSMNKAMRLLLSNADTVEEMVICKTEHSNVQIDDDLVDKLHKCKKYSSESHSDVIERLLDSQSE